MSTLGPRQWTLYNISPERESEHVTEMAIPNR